MQNFVSVVRNWKAEKIRRKLKIKIRRSKPADAEIDFKLLITNIIILTGTSKYSKKRERIIIIDWSIKIKYLQKSFNCFWC